MSPTNFERYYLREKEEEGEEKGEPVLLSRSRSSPARCFAGRIFDDRREKKTTFLSSRGFCGARRLLAEASQGDFFSRRRLLGEK
ncbi:hypothetical protein BHE74_00008779 [Ensete ventricosum]|nr:hypothetical protein GW17_00046895 [Ensete ventricosum]RWW82740.1 hypothetical protein BHE74_00008779 [Ensete ventricosum]RZR91302.1 hypothetical protein BHM03_00019403 [Ensete ventricosum]